MQQSQRPGQQPMPYQPVPPVQQPMYPGQPMPPRPYPDQPIPYGPPPPPMMPPYQQHIMPQPWPQSMMPLQQQQMVNVVNVVNVGPPVRQSVPMLVRILYFFFIGWWLGMVWLFCALFLCALIFTMPLGLMMLNRLGTILTLA